MSLLLLQGPRNQMFNLKQVLVSTCTPSNSVVPNSHSEVDDQMPISGTRASNEKKWAPKVRTGCITCKRRRVKCDEKKPACDRCSTAGLTCEGYAKIPRSHLFYSTSELRRLRVTRNGCLIGSIGTLGSPELTSGVNRAKPAKVETLPASIFASQLEYDAYTHWLSATRSLFQTSKDALIFWSETVPQAASKSRLVLDALVAVSLRAKCLSESEYDEGHGQNSVMALEHGMSAIRNIRAGTEPHTENVLLAAVLLWLMELIGGRLDVADLHLKSAFRIVEQEPAESSSPLFNIVRETWRLWSICYKPVPIDPDLIETEKNPVAKEGLYFLALAKDCFKNTIDELREKANSAREHDITILESSLGLTLWILTKWMMLFGNMWYSSSDSDETQEGSSTSTSPSYSDSSEIPDAKVLSSAILRSLQKSARDAAHTTVTHQEIAVNGVLNVFFSLISGSDVALKQELQAVLEGSSYAISTHIQALHQQQQQQQQRRQSATSMDQPNIYPQFVQFAALHDVEEVEDVGALQDIGSLSDIGSLIYP